MKNAFGLLFICVLFYSCSSPQSTPQLALDNYVKARFDGKNLDDVKNFLTEEFFEQLENADSEDKEKIWKLENLKLRNYRILSSSCSSEDCRITYYLSYFTMGENKKEFMTETKKIALMKKIDEKWKVADISHVKTFHDSLIDIGVESSQ